MNRLLVLALVLAAAGLGVVLGCGAEERISREQFGARLESIDREGGERWGRLAQRAEALKPGQPLPSEVKQPMTELIEFQRRVIVELGKLDPPDDAEAAVERLSEALRERTEIFEQVIAAGLFTRQEFEQVTSAGQKIDEAFARLRKAGYLGDAAAERSHEPSTRVESGATRPDGRHRATL